MRNQIGIPPLEPPDDGPTPGVRRPAPAAGGGAAASAPAGHRKPLRYTGDDAGTAPGAAQRHAGMDPDVREAARKADVPDVGTSLTHPITERDSNASLYIGLAIGVIATIVIVLLLMAIL